MIYESYCITYLVLKKLKKLCLLKVISIYWFFHCILFLGWSFIKLQGSQLHWCLKYLFLYYICFICLHAVFLFFIKKYYYCVFATILSFLFDIFCLAFLGFYFFKMSFKHHFSYFSQLLKCNCLIIMQFLVLHNF